ncbi:exodeoxyribonuclease VII large subunit [Microbulbifer sp. OS29]|uniref:Exodeoxyribonuclease 7 large subunit n=1 Tax=Microbulbifer okhotskensis TaxID=2926617 RepID=A0A9X2J6V7_9GAMM|nr:exodeoxyribonuclease VII large subunit [Microbulbifer okhotskensis]MCO1335040.1 exodeoxyribonuclease VII large subunit [Microbulbifer okhotskensis]
MQPVSPSQNANRSVLTVSDLNREVKHLLESNVPLLWISGEISNFSVPSSGHWYFSLKDSRAQVRCAMFRGRNRSVAFQPKNGREILIRARVSLYEGRGEFQLIVEHMEEAGFGALMRQLEQLKTKLSAEGLFDATKKRPLPFLPTNIGIVTSPTGAAVRDMIHVLSRRHPAAKIELWPVAVQGQGAAQQIAAAIEKAGRSGRHDLLIVGRGGGSLEDLWSFNEEVVARALANCPIPTISAVGHETDTTVADLAADLRAPTPSAAAEIASANATELSQQLEHQQRRLHRAIGNQLKYLQQQIQLRRNRLRHPREQLLNQAQRLDHLEMRLVAAGQQQILSRKSQLASTIRAFDHCQPERRLSEGRKRLIQSQGNLQRAMHLLLQRRGDRLSHGVKLLQNVSPLAVLQRGYAIAMDSNNQAIRNTKDLNADQEVRVRLASGSFSAKVTSTED